MELHFTKMEGIGNDYIYVDGINQDVNMTPEFIVFLIVILVSVEMV